MLKKIFRQLIIYSVSLSCPWIVLPAAIADETTGLIPSNAQELSDSAENNPTENDNDAMEQVTNVSQLRDVQPTDWAYEALRAIVERYGCLAGYPDGTFRGDRGLTRYEFAAGLNACLRQVENLIGGSTPTTPNSVAQEDLERLRRLQEEFGTELATLGTRVNNLESRTAFVEQRQFSTTTKLNGEALFSPRFIFAEDKKPDTSSVPYGTNSRFEGPAEKEPTLGYRVRLTFNTSFTGKDLLVTRLDAFNLRRFRLGMFTNQGALHPDDTTGDEGQNFLVGPPTGRVNNSNVRLDLLSYTFPISSQGNIRIIGTGGKLDDFAPSLNALDYGGAALGSISEFGQRNPIYRISGAGAGAGIDYKLNDIFRLSLGYLGGNRITAGSPSNPVSFFNTLGGPRPVSAGSGIFNNETYGAIAQLTVSPIKNIDLGLTYVRTNFSTADYLSIRPGPGGGVGSHNSDGPLGAGPLEINSYGVEAMFRVSPKFVVSGWAGMSKVTAPNGGYSPVTGVELAPPGGEATITNWAVTLAFPDLLKEGSLGGIVFGQTPRTIESDGRNGISLLPLSDNEAESYHIEAFYRYQLNDNISLTPGVIVITNPEYDPRNQTIVTSTLRVVFTF